jgi:hypothetical protein
MGGGGGGHLVQIKDRLLSRREIPSLLRRILVSYLTLLSELYVFITTDERAIVNNYLERI